jgi:hypothetical protein
MKDEEERGGCTTMRFLNRRKRRGLYNAEVLRGMPNNKYPITNNQGTNL